MPKYIELSSQPETFIYGVYIFVHFLFRIHRCNITLVLNKDKNVSTTVTQKLYESFRLPLYMCSGIFVHVYTYVTGDVFNSLGAYFIYGL